LWGDFCGTLQLHKIKNNSIIIIKAKVKNNFASSSTPGLNRAEVVAEAICVCYNDMFMRYEVIYIQYVVGGHGQIDGFWGAISWQLFRGMYVLV
jgi:hypothetical protein